MKYTHLAITGLAALVLGSSCKFEISNGTPNIDVERVVEEAYTKPVIFQENEVMPIAFLDTDLANIKSQYQRVALNLTRLYSTEQRGVSRGTALLVNPMQILTAAHVTTSSTLEYVISNENGELKTIKGWIRNIDSDTTADIAVINLQIQVAERPSLQFYDQPIYKGLPVALITYNENIRIIREGEITRIYTEKGREKFETNIAAIPGNSGGAYVDQAEGKIIGVVTDAINKFQGSLGPSVHTLDVQRRERVLTADERKRIQLYNDVQEFQRRKGSLKYEDFALGDFYLKGDESELEICTKQALFTHLDRYCFSKFDFPTITAIRVQKIIAKGIGELTLGVKFTDGRKYEQRELLDLEGEYKNASMSLTSSRGEW